ncbi:uncharacterized protein LOC114650881 [Erpetoichthys calabaricus]|uniref:uncharacterized protein LOC114650881 n=1 Tax=Erpetoichthys calabaricus TaxID=27687 RepID=UPI00109FECB3|nr:uncharacterized protein LOC114650881 [Erpetoichthys calabaricus]
MEENSLLHNPLRKSLLVLVLSFCCTYADLCSLHTCVIADVGSDATLPCGNLTGQDTSQVNWYKNSPDTLKLLLTYSVTEQQLFQLNETKPRIKLLHSPNEDFGLQILQVQQLDAGNYTCKATMNTGVKSTQWELITHDSKPVTIRLYHIIVCVVVTTIVILIISGVIVCRNNICKLCWKTTDSNTYISQQGQTRSKEGNEIYMNCPSLRDASHSNKSYHYS